MGTQLFRRVRRRKRTRVISMMAEPKRIHDRYTTHTVSATRVFSPTKGDEPCFFHSDGCEPFTQEVRALTVGHGVYQRGKRNIMITHPLVVG